MNDLWWHENHFVYDHDPCSVAICKPPQVVSRTMFEVFLSWICIFFSHQCIVAEFILMAFVSRLDFRLLLRVKSSKFENLKCVLTLSQTPSPLVIRVAYFVFQYTAPLYRISKIIHMYHTFSPISIWNLHIFVCDDIVRKLVWC